MKIHHLDEKHYQRKATLEYRSKSLRKSSTDAEKLLWSLLRDKRFMGHKFRRQHVIDGYIIDFFCVEENVGIELDGSQHNQPEAINYDIKRSEILMKAGTRIIRFWNNDVINKTIEVLESLVEFLKKK